MKEIYWITRLDGIHNLCDVLIVLGILAVIALAGGIAMKRCNKQYHSEEDPDIDYIIGQSFVKISKPLIVAMCIAIPLEVFVPTTKEALLIYGVGGTIDYVRSNPTAKQLPDKAVKALDKYLDELNQDNNEEK